MNAPHIHRDLIILWADGAVIEELCSMNDFERWFISQYPSWSKTAKYRVKPEPKPDYKVHVFVTAGIGRGVIFGISTVTEHPADNLRLTFDGETRKLKSAEVI